MRYFKSTYAGYILGVGIGNICEGITEDEYNSLCEIISNQPRAEEGFGYKLRNDLTWEQYKLPAEEDSI